MKQTSIKLYGTDWCGDCHRAKIFLKEHHIKFDYIDIDKHETAMTFVLEKNQGLQIIPTIVFPDGSFLAEPTNSELAKKLGIDH